MEMALSECSQRRAWRRRQVLCESALAPFASGSRVRFESSSFANHPHFTLVVHLCLITDYSSHRLTVEECRQMSNNKASPAGYV